MSWCPVYLRSKSVLFVLAVSLRTRLQPGLRSSVPLSPLTPSNGAKTAATMRRMCWMDEWVVALAHCGSMHRTLDLQKQVQWQVQSEKKFKAIGDFQ